MMVKFVFAILIYGKKSVPIISTGHSIKVAAVNPRYVEIIDVSF
ncbi:hypothetical protein [Maribacter antarcticus]|nr:hypothetical protein [Maribacter antarcticus]